MHASVTTLALTLGTKDVACSEGAGAEGLLGGLSPICSCS